MKGYTKLLSICIPNYNRLEEFKRLIEGCVSQIIDNSLQDDVSICICDDCSPDDPTRYVNDVIKHNSEIDIIYKRNSHNCGMDYNFREAVLNANSEFCWLIGNDDELEVDGLKNAVNILKQYHESIDFIVTPFDIQDDKNQYLSF